MLVWPETGLVGQAWPKSTGEESKQYIQLVVLGGKGSYNGESIKEDFRIGFSNKLLLSVPPCSLHKQSLHTEF